VIVGAAVSTVIAKTAETSLTLPEGNNFAGIDDSSAWTFSAASLSTTVAWSGANVDVTDGYILNLYGVFCVTV
jgi:hypothetical protein